MEPSDTPDFIEHTEHTLRCLGCEQEFTIRVPRLVSALHTFAAWLDHVDGLCPKCWKAKQEAAVKPTGGAAV